MSIAGTGSRARQPTLAGSGVASSLRHGKFDVDRALSRGLDELLFKAGFRDSGITVASGVAIAESGMFRNGRYHVNPLTVRAAEALDAVWGPYVGVFGIRSMRNPPTLGLDRLRLRSQLTDPLFNARAAFTLSKAGSDWSQWPSYASGLSATLQEQQEVLVDGWNGGSGGPADAPAATSMHGRTSALDFATLALQQTSGPDIAAAERVTNAASLFDVSELVEWAAALVGCFMPEGADDQWAYLQLKDRVVTVETAVTTRGALLWSPSRVAISMGDGRLVSAVNPVYGVTAFNPVWPWEGAGLVPGMRYA